MERLLFFTNIFNDLAAALLFASGIYFTFRFKGVQLRSLHHTVKRFFSGNARESFRMFSASLAGAAGVGNIVGVSSALMIGGPGAVFWMWTAAFLGMATKYAETRLSVIFAATQGKYTVSPMNYIKKAGKSRFLPVCFASAGTAVSLLMGNIVQSRALADSACEGFGINRTVVGFVTGAVLFVILSFGFRGVGAFAEKAVPAMTAVYAVFCAAVLIVNFREIPSAFADIFIYAFKPMSAAGGIAGAGISAVVRNGVSKGIFSNEAGLGSAGFSYGQPDSSPEVQGEFASFDVFADTIVISTLSALVLLTGSDLGTQPSVLSVFSGQFGMIGSTAGSVCVILFAFASMVTWAYCGEACFAYLSKGKLPLIFRAIFALCAMIGSAAQTDTIWSAAEIANAVMMAVNMFAVLKLYIKKEDKND